MTFELPPEQNNAAAWYGPEMSKRSDWAMPLTSAEVAEVESATKVLAAREADIAAIRAADFPLPTLGARLKAVIAETGMAVSGPNCLGNFNAHVDFVTLPDDRPRIARARDPHLGAEVDHRVADEGQAAVVEMALQLALAYPRDERPCRGEDPRGGRQRGVLERGDLGR